MPSQAFFPRWPTAAVSDAVDTSPMELTELGTHVDRCNGERGRWFALRCTVDAVHEFVAARFVTTVVILGAIAVLTAVTL